MNTSRCANVNDLSLKLQALLTQPPLVAKGATPEYLQQFIQNNLQLIGSQVGNASLQQLLLQLSDRINAEFNNAEAHQLAFNVMGIARGIFEAGAKPAWETLPKDALGEILSHIPPQEVNPMRTKVKSTLGAPALTSKAWFEAASEQQIRWINEEAVSLRVLVGYKSASEAIDFVIKSEGKIQAVNLLDFEDLKYQDIEKLFKSCKNITKLLISSTVVAVLPQEAVNLEELRCYDCITLKSLPEGMSRLKKLECFTCPGLTSLPKGMSNLRMLDCRHCPFSSLPEDMSKLQTLHLYECNSLTTLPEGMHELQSLGCGGCPISRIPEGLSELLELNCNYCPVSSLPAGMSKLQTLSCDGCLISSLPEGMSALRQLYCERCPFSQAQDLPVPKDCVIYRESF